MPKVKSPPMAKGPFSGGKTPKLAVPKAAPMPSFGLGAAGGRKKKRGS
jgi:hypothetical protein